MALFFLPSGKNSFRIDGEQIKRSRRENGRRKENGEGKENRDKRGNGVKKGNGRKENNGKRGESKNRRKAKAKLRTNLHDDWESGIDGFDNESAGEGEGEGEGDGGDDYSGCSGDGDCGADGSGAVAWEDHDDDEGDDADNDVKEAEQLTRDEKSNIAMGGRYRRNATFGVRYRRDSASQASRYRRDAPLLHLYPERFIEVFIVADSSMLQFYGPKEIHIYLLTMLHIVSMQSIDHTCNGALFTYPMFNINLTTNIFLKLCMGFEKWRLGEKGSGEG